MWWLSSAGSGPHKRAEGYSAIWGELWSTAVFTHNYKVFIMYESHLILVLSSHEPTDRWGLA